MHRLDGHINDIEPRILAICKYAAAQEEISLPESLASYGWILLDSWICWRTLRFLLKETFIEDTVNDKWFQTPSSYNASQLKAVWKLTDGTTDYIKNRLGKNLKQLIDQTVQANRNSCAHFTKHSNITGADTLVIKQIFDVFSVVFLAYEVNSFIEVIVRELKIKGYKEFQILTEKGLEYNNNSVKDDIMQFEKNKGFMIKCINAQRKNCILVARQDGCWASVDGHAEEKPISNAKQIRYIFCKNKGFYQDVDLFLSTLENVWEELLLQSE